MTDDKSPVTRIQRIDLVITYSDDDTGPKQGTICIHEFDDLTLEDGDKIQVEGEFEYHDLEPLIDRDSPH